MTESTHCRRITARRSPGWKRRWGRTPRATDLVVDGTIQRFEFAFELAWKLMQAALRAQGLDAASPRAAIKVAFQIGWLPDGEGWIDMLEDRNKTSHLYDETAAQTIYDKIKRQHIDRLLAWREQAK